MVAALGELREKRPGVRVFRALHVLKGADRVAVGDTLSVPTNDGADLKPGAFAILLAEQAAGGALDWSLIHTNELEYAYLVRAPSLRTKTAARLRYFAKYLENRDPVIAEDAYLEFAHAPYDQVADVADALDSAKLRQWLLDEAVPESHKGFYGLALGLAGGASARETNAKFLRDKIESSADDFAAGFDGVLGGYLMLTNEAGLKFLEDRFLSNPRAKPGHVRHALTALRFYHEFGHGIPPAKLAAAMQILIGNRALAAQAITELGRWKAWDALPDVLGLYDKQGYDCAGHPSGDHWIPVGLSRSTGRNRVEPLAAFGPGNRLQGGEVPVAVSRRLNSSIEAKRLCVGAKQPLPPGTHAFQIPAVRYRLRRD